MLERMQAEVLAEPQANILVLEDSHESQRMIKAALEPHYWVAIAGSLAEARAHLERKRFQLLVLDVNLPDGDGFQFCGEVRAKEETRLVPVIFLTGRSDLEDKLKGFSLGADDYIVKPFEARELRARVEAKLARERQLRSAAPDAAGRGADESLARGALRFELPTLRAYLVEGGKKTELGLTPIEFKILYHLARNETQVVSREQLLATVWGGETHVFDRATDKHVSSLRNKLGPYAAYIETVSRVGYRFVVKPVA
jgi:DNA-binding response OmpR family regulator